MNNYTEYNLHIKSCYELPGFRSDNDLLANGYPEVRIEETALDRNFLKHRQNNGMLLAGEFEDLFICAIEGGEKITVHPYPDADMDFVRSVVTGELLAALLRQRRLLVLHGVCVTNGTHTFALVGYSGWGKSTSAAFFLKHGYTLLSEDVLAIDINKPIPEVIPGPPVLRLKPDAGNLLFEDFESFPKVYKTTVKRIYQSTAFDSKSPAPFHLDKIYLLEGEERNSNQIKALPLQEALVEMVRHSRTIKWLTDSSFMKLHFRQCTALLNQIPVSLLQRKKTLESLPEIKALIEEDLDSTDSPDPGQGRVYG